MTIRKKTILFSALALGAFLAAVYLVSHFALMNSFARLEADSAQNTVGQIRRALDHKQTNLEALAKYYAQSDAVAEILASSKAASEHPVFSPDALRKLDIDFVAILNAGNDLAFFSTSASSSPDAVQIETISSAGSHYSTSNVLPSRGILQVAGRILLLSYQPLLPDAKTAMSRGTLILARELDDVEVASLSTSLGFPVWLEPADTLTAERQGVAWSNGVDSARIESDSTMLDYVAVQDLAGVTRRLLVARTQRSLYLEGKNESRYLLTLLMVAGVVYCGILLFFVDEVLVKRITSLAKDAGKITISGDLSLRLTCEGKDELSSLARTLNTMLSGIQRAKTELLEAQESLRFHAEHDALTGVLNRRAIRDVLRKELARCRRESNTLGVVLADVDHFKKINDHYGHAAGDAVLVGIVQRITSVLRTYDALGRYGGEEFLIIAPNCDLAMAQKLAERIRSAITDEAMDIGDNATLVTLSMGVTLGTADSDPEFLVAQADTAMYNAKRNGRNRVEIGLDLPEIEPVETRGR